MTTGYVLFIIIVYFGLLFLISRLSVKKADSSTFFIANRNAPWPLVAYGMIGVAISGITFISVPGQVAETKFSYFQMVLGFAIGLIIVAFVLVPIFYRIKAISIYSFLNMRFGKYTHKTGAIFFLLAQVATASFKLFLMAHVLQLLLFDRLGLPFELTVLITLLLIWLYTYRGGIQTVIITDTLQTTFLIVAVVLSIWSITQQMNISIGGLYQEMKENDMARIFYWDWDHPQNFFKLILAGTLLTVMTNGLDQSVMQKHLTCKDLRSSQKNIVTLALILLVVNLLFLYLGGALHVFSSQKGIVLPEQTDSIYPMLALDQLGMITGSFFLVGIAAAAYSSADSSLTGLTTSFCVDVLNFSERKTDNPKLRQGVHLGFTLLIFFIILIFNAFNDESVLSAFIRTAGFIYGPLVGLFAFGIFSKKVVDDRWVPLIAIIAPVVSIVLDRNSAQWFEGYQFGYGILVVNSLIALMGLFVLSLFTPKKIDHEQNEIIEKVHT
ncbi:MAG: sodium:solute symporter [Candidatus Cyclobacteriaceae bacterium M3_2C_046]